MEKLMTNPQTDKTMRKTDEGKTRIFFMLTSLT